MSYLLPVKYPAPIQLHQDSGVSLGPLSPYQGCFLLPPVLEGGIEVNSGSTRPFLVQKQSKEMFFAVF